MLRLSQSPPILSALPKRSRFLAVFILVVCSLALVRAVVLEPFEIPTGSMAPTLRGRHRVGVCPSCGSEVVVGRARDDSIGSAEARLYSKATCTNCGHMPVPIAHLPELPGDRVIVDKTAFRLREPARWEIIVYRLLGTFYIKRLLGLPGEKVLIHEGDLYVNGRLMRKTFAQAKSMRVLLCDDRHMPAEAWGRRWEQSGGASSTGSLPRLDGRDTPDEWTYANYFSAANKCEPIRDEYTYNAGLHADSECVHDFMIETDVHVRGGGGTLTLRFRDGAEPVEIVMPVSDDAAVGTHRLRPGGRYRIEAALVDRRLSLMVDGVSWSSEDLPEVKVRAGVERPFGVRAVGVQADLLSFRLYRDVHFGQQGENGVRGKSARMGVDQYFVLGDNSPNSEDSRFYPDQGAVPADCLIGPVILKY